MDITRGNVSNHHRQYYGVEAGLMIITLLTNFIQVLLCFISAKTTYKSVTVAKRWDLKTKDQKIHFKKIRYNFRIKRNVRQLGKRCQKRKRQRQFSESSSFVGPLLRDVVLHGGADASHASVGIGPASVLDSRSGSLHVVQVVLVVIMEELCTTPFLND
jgi:hypothetical protein